MGQVLYNKYRSKNFGEVIGQDYITSSLDNALKNNKIAHAYLFTGPRGVGKTSVARILARSVNGVADYDSTQLDIIEIDAASNRRIDEIRDLRDKVNIAPTNSKYKVYIIDEVHMLTKEAFNALLKTLEEPPAHVIFILATTESHKLPDTIVSRTQRYSFRPIDQNNLVKHLKAISKNEKIKIDDDALELIASHGGGSFRDSISILDQLRNRDEKITIDTVNESLGLPSSQAISGLIKTLDEGSKSNIVNQLTELFNNGYGSSLISKQLLSQIRSDILIRGDSVSFDYLSLMTDLIDVPSKFDPDAYLEVLLYKYCSKNNKPTIIIEDSKPPAVRSEKVVAPITKKKTIETNTDEKVVSPEENNEPKKKVSGSVEFNKLIWKDLLNIVKKTNNTLYGLLMMARPKMIDGTLNLDFGHLFYQKKINDIKNKDIVMLKFKELTGHDINIAANYVPELKKVDTEKQNKDLNNISNIFDGAEVLQS
jgi:DNA polymerase-3 subunit gamma/tau